jgi:large subunit ribosomal protein L35
MPKMKTKSSAKKRFKKTASGKIKYTQAYRRHLLTRKSRKPKRNLRRSSYISTVDHNRIAKLLPYG